MSERIIVTGAAGGLGKTVVHQLLHSEHEVIAVVEPGKNHQKDEMNELSHIGKLTIVEADLLNLKEVQNFINEVSDGGSISGAAGLVGGFGMDTLEDLNQSNLEKFIHLNFYSALNLSRALLPVFKIQNQGKLLMMSAKPAHDLSISGQTFSYSISKKMVMNLVDHINGTFKYIRAATIAPDIIDTPANREAMPEANFNQWVKSQEIAKLIAYFFSKDGDKLSTAHFKIFGQQ